jgi:plasmid stabilization system protein ParE
MTSIKPFLRSETNLAYSIRITTVDRRDAQKYADFIRIEHKSPEAARKWLDGLQVAIKKLEELPNRYPLIPEAEELGFPFRSLIYHSHRIV